MLYLLYSWLVVHLSRSGFNCFARNLDVLNGDTGGFAGSSHITRASHMLRKQEAKAKLYFSFCFEKIYRSRSEAGIKHIFFVCLITLSHQKILFCNYKKHMH